MNRRGFLRGLFGAAVAPAAAKLIPGALMATAAVTPSQTAYTTYLLPPQALRTAACTVGEYADYCSFSDIALTVSIDADYQKVCEELSHRFSRSLDAHIALTTQ